MRYLFDSSIISLRVESSICISISPDECHYDGAEIMVYTCGIVYVICACECSPHTTPAR